MDKAIAFLYVLYRNFHPAQKIWRHSQNPPHFPSCPPMCTNISRKVGEGRPQIRGPDCAFSPN